MLPYILGDLSAETSSRLLTSQNYVDNLTTKTDRYNKARALFKDKRTLVFNEIKERLHTASPPIMSCFYCERDRHRDIDHIRPCRHYPEETFSWKNYVYACSICNQDKKEDRFAVINSEMQLVEFNRSLDLNLPPPVGIHALIDIRKENPLNFFCIDLETGSIQLIKSDEISTMRAKFTRNLLDLDNDSLRKVRVQAKNAFVDYITRYKAAVLASNHERATRIVFEVAELPQPSVLAEMLRQSHKQTWLRSLLENFPIERMHNSIVVAQTL